MKIKKLLCIITLTILLHSTTYLSAQDFSYESNPIYNSSGIYIVYVSNQAGSLDLWLFDIVNQEHRNVTNFNDGRDFYPTWSPDGQYIAYVSDFASNEDIWLMSVKDSSVVNLTELDERPNGFPIFSPDGTEIAFITDLENGLQSKVQVINIETQNIRTIVTEGDFVYTNTTWSYDGRYLAFTATFIDADVNTANDLIDNTSSYPDGIRIFDFDSEELISIGLQQHYLSPTWSPISNQILISHVDGDNIDLMLVDIKDSSIVELTTTEGIRETLPAWSHDGALIAFVSNEGDDDDIWVMDLSTNNKTNLTHSQTEGSFDTSPTWSPDNNVIAFSSNKEGKPSIWTISLDGTVLQNLDQR